MGIDLEQRKRGRKKVTYRRKPRSGNVYLNLTHQLYSFLARRTSSNFNKVVAKRLAMSRSVRCPLSVARLVKATQKRPKDTVVVVGTITDDCRVLTVPKMKVCALRVTETARAKIMKAGGEIITFDQLALQSPLGKNTQLLRGPTKTMKKFRHFNGAPRIRAKGKNFEKGKFTNVKRNKRARKTN